MKFNFRRFLKFAPCLIVWISMLACSLFVPPATPIPVTPTVSSPTITSTITPTQPPTQRPTAISTHDPRILNPANQHLYLYVTNKKNWHDARDYCVSRGGHLVTIETASENSYIFGLTDGNTWLGATDEIEEGTWVWVTGQAWNYTDWNEGEPNNCCPPRNCGGIDCTPESYLSYSSNGITWNDNPRTTLSFVCEWETVSP